MSCLESLVRAFFFSRKHAQRKKGDEIMESAGKLFEQTLSHYEKKEYVEAGQLVDTLLAGNPEFHRGWFLKGVIFEETGRPADAQRCYAKSGNLFTLLLRLGMQLEEIDSKRALVYYDRALQMDPANNVLLLRRGLLLEKNSSKEQAGACFRKLSLRRELFSRLVAPLGFMVFLSTGGVMMFARGERSLSLFAFASAVVCFFWLKRDSGAVITMMQKKNEYT